MRVRFATNKIEKTFKDMNSLKKAYNECATKVAQRYNELVAALNLAEVSKMWQVNGFHELTQNLKEVFSINVSGKFRMLFKPDYEKDATPRKEDGMLDYGKIDQVVITEPKTNKTHE